MMRRLDRVRHWRRIGDPYWMRVYGRIADRVWKRGRDLWGRTWLVADRVNARIKDKLVEGQQ